MALYPTPGLVVFSSLASGSSVRGLWTINGRSFAVCGSHLYEILSNGTNISRSSALVDDGLPASMCASPDYLVVASGGTVYVLNLTTNAVTTPAVTASGYTDVMQVAYCDGYFLALFRNSQSFLVSDLLDPTNWPAGQVIRVSVFPDNIVSMIVDHREVTMFGRRNSVSYYNAGTTQIFEVITGSYAEHGSCATFATSKLDNTVFWLSGDERGVGINFRLEGYRPQRISNHAVENAIQGYSTITDAEGFAYQDRGHTFWQIWFPTAGHTWVYDAATGMWHERTYWNNGVEEAHRARCHTYAFEKHLVGDRASGTIYEMAVPDYVSGAWSFVTDFGNEIRRVRRAPHISDEEAWNFYAQLQVYLETGIGPIPPLYNAAESEQNPASGPVSVTTDIGLGPSTWSDYVNVIPGTGTPSVVSMLNVGSGGAGSLALDITGLLPAGTIPADATITGIVATVLGNQLTGTSPLESLRMILGGTLVGLTKTATRGVTGSDAVLTYGTSSDTWSAGFTPADTEDATSGIRLWYASDVGPGSTTVRVTQLTVTFYFKVPRAPELNLRWSNDGGHTWSNELTVGCGQAGEYTARAMFRRLGRARNRVFELSMSDPIGWRLLDGYLKLVPGNGT